MMKLLLVGLGILGSVSAHATAGCYSDFSGKSQDIISIEEFVRLHAGLKAEDKIEIKSETTRYDVTVISHSYGNEVTRVEQPENIYQIAINGDRMIELRQDNVMHASALGVELLCYIPGLMPMPEGFENADY